MYGNGNPVSYVDPSGNFGFADLTVTQKIIGGIVGIGVPVSLYLASRLPIFNSDKATTSELDLIRRGADQLNRMHHMNY